MSRTNSKTYTVEVTRADINRGEPHDPKRSPIGYAIARVIKDFTGISMLGNYFYIPDPVRKIYLPYECLVWTQVYDAAGEHIPFTFDLEVPC
jgi:hypothetical protein